MDQLYPSKSARQLRIKRDLIQFEEMILNLYEKKERSRDFYCCILLPFKSRFIEYLELELCPITVQSVKIQWVPYYGEHSAHEGKCSAMI